MTVSCLSKDTLASGYRKCSLCDNGTHSICVKCTGSYTCHCELLSEQPSAPPPQQKQKQESQRKVIDVSGQQIEPICNHRRCKHKFSVHGYDTHK